ncbi:DUF5959 family protein [Promicromonospora sp. NPDC057138]|uniref:DUF5959 family protein n=1 Tax=Promicromonospora sp. NPDC057138 TaxID=3346031 RepID=UPI003639735C
MTQSARTHQTLSRPIELFRFGGEGNLVALRLQQVDRGPDGRVEQFIGEIVVETSFVSGATPIHLGVPGDLTAWQGMLDHLDAGHDVHWMEDQKSPEVLIRWESDDRFEVTVRDRLASLTDVRTVVTANEKWFDTAYDLLDRAYELAERPTE